MPDEPWSPATRLPPGNSEMAGGTGLDGSGRRGPLARPPSVNMNAPDVPPGPLQLPLSVARSIVASTGDPVPPGVVTMTRGARHLRVTASRQVMVLRGEIGHKDLWRVDLVTGAEAQMTHLPPGFAVRDFDVSPDGRELVIEQIQDQSDIVLLDIPE